MSYQITDDGDEICIRATISQRWELAELAAKLQQRVDGLPVNLTTMIPIIEHERDPGPDQVLISEGHQPDAQDVNRKELSNER